MSTGNLPFHQYSFLSIIYFILKHPATKNTQIDQSINRTNFSSGNQKAMKRQLWCAMKAAPLIRACLAELSQGGLNCQQPGSQFCGHVRYITYITNNTSQNNATAWLERIHKAYNYVSEENNQKSFEFGVFILATARKGFSIVIIAISFWSHN